VNIFPLVFCRGGSKGVPRKNLRMLNGRSLLERSIGHGLDFAGICFVSTDCGEIAKQALKLGAKVIDRPSELATDSSPEMLSWKHACQALSIGGNDIFVSLPTTAPLRRFESIQIACDLYRDSDADIVCAAYELERNPFLNMYELSVDGSLEPLLDQMAVRRQDSKTVLGVSTVIYVSNGEYILRNKAPFSGTVKPIIVSRLEAIDIDTEDDLILAGAIERSDISSFSRHEK
jgi:N,N'-diacetyl-8-epilegionaminate cytidylyltransferase